MPALNAPACFVCVYLLILLLPVIYGMTIRRLALWRRDWSLPRSHVAAGLRQSCPGTRGCHLPAAASLPPRPCHRIPAAASLQRLQPVTPLSPRPKEMVQWDSAWFSALTGRFLDLLLFCPPFPSPPFSFPSLVFCQIFCCFFLGVLVAHWFVSLLPYPPPRKVLYCSEFDFYEAMPDRIGFPYIFKHYKTTPVSF